MQLVRTDNHACVRLMSINPCFAEITKEFELYIGKVLADFKASKPNATNSLRMQLTQSLKDFKQKALVVPEIPRSTHDANYKVDFLKTFPEGLCGHRHRIAIELCFDNRQAIGTNLLKVHLANKLGGEGTGVGILVVAEDSLRDLVFDNSVAAESEYETALFSSYASVIDSPISLFILTS